jgi:GTP-binding protein YchF
LLTAALVGLPLGGRSTVLNLLTGLGLEVSGFATGRTDTHRGVVDVPDRRLGHLAAMYQPRKVTPAQIEVIEVPGLVRGASEGAGVGNRFLSEIREVDAVVHVLRAFRDPAVPHPEERIDPLADLEIVELELLMADLQVLERRLERLRTGKRRPDDERERALVERCVAALGEGRSVRALGLDDEERSLLAGFGLLTDKPQVWLVNVDEDALKDASDPQVARVAARARDAGVPLVVLSAKIEAEIAQLGADERDAFLADLGLNESGIDRLAQAAYEALGLISFLTAGPDEVRAWPIRRGTTAQVAAGRIHSDIGRGFIRAEVVAFADLEAAGSMARARELGRVRLEGKEYVMQDGDIVNFRFHV